MELFFRGIKLKLYPSITEYWSIKKNISTMLFLLQRDEVLQTSEMSDCSFPAVLGSWQLQRRDKNDSAFLHIILYKASPSCSETEYFTQMSQRVWRKLWSKLDMWLWLLHFIAGDKGNVFFSLPPPTQRCSDIQPRGVRGHRSSASHSVSLPLGWWVDLAERGVAGGLHSRGPHLQKHVRDALPQVRVAVCLLCAYLCRLVNKISLGVCSC